MKEMVETSPTQEPNEIPRKFGPKPGFQLIDFTQVALPVFVVPIDAIVIASKSLALVDEFVLRSIVEEVDTLDDLSGFLGLDGPFVKKRLGELIGQDLVAYGPSGENGRPNAKLTAKGTEALQKTMIVQTE